MKIGYVRVGENTIPVKIITVKVDYSDSSGAYTAVVCPGTVRIVHLYCEDYHSKGGLF